METFNHVLGLGAEPKDLTFLQISLRGAIVFVLTLAIVRFGDKRFLSKKTAFDAVLGFIFASMMARAINGSAAFWPTLGGGLVLVLIHRVMAHFSMRHHGFGKLIKGTHNVVIKDGVVIQEALEKENFSEHDLHEDLRTHGNVSDISEVKEARIERNGDVSVVKKRCG